MTIDAVERTANHRFLQSPITVTCYSLAGFTRSLRMLWSGSVSGVSWQWNCWMRCLLLFYCCAILIMAEQSEQQPNTVEVMGFHSSIRDDTPGLSRHITIYWRMIPKTQEMGTVNYTVHVYSNGSLLDKKPYLLTNTWARFGQLEDEESYTFKINATDEMGSPGGYAQITVPTTDDLVEKPSPPMAWPCGNRRYYLNWDGVEGTTSYTIFWCTTERIECNGYLNWKRVDNRTSNKLIDVEEDGQHQFFVTANIDNATSGLTPFIMFEYIPRRGCDNEEWL